VLGIASCTVFMRDVTIEVHRRQRICLPIDYSNEVWPVYSNETGKMIRTSFEMAAIIGPLTPRMQ
jgi:hypothetical protein